MPNACKHSHIRMHRPTVINIDTCTQITENRRRWFDKRIGRPIKENVNRKLAHCITFIILSTLLILSVSVRLRGQMDTNRVAAAVTMFSSYFDSTIMPISDPQPPPRPMRCLFSCQMRIHLYPRLTTKQRKGIKENIYDAARYCNNGNGCYDTATTVVRLSSATNKPAFSRTRLFAAYVCSAVLLLFHSVR